MNDNDWMAILACPLCEDRPPLVRKEDLLVCPSCRRGFRIIDEIPRLLPEDALPPKEVERLQNGS